MSEGAKPAAFPEPAASGNHTDVAQNVAAHAVLEPTDDGDGHWKWEGLQHAERCLSVQGKASDHNGQERGVPNLMEQILEHFFLVLTRSTGF